MRSPDTVYEVTIMVDSRSPAGNAGGPDRGNGKPVPSERFRKLPERIRPEDMTTTQATEAAPDPTMGRDPERDFMLRNAGF